MKCWRAIVVSLSAQIQVMIQELELKRNRTSGVILSGCEGYIALGTEILRFAQNDNSRVGMTDPSSGYKA